MKHLALVASCVAAVDGEVALAGAAFAAFAYLAGPPAALLFSPVALLLARGGVGGEHRDGGDDTEVFAGDGTDRPRDGGDDTDRPRSRRRASPGFELPRVHPTQSIHPTRSIPRAPRPRRVVRRVVRRVDRGVPRGGRASRRDDVGVDARDARVPPSRRISRRTSDCTGISSRRYLTISARFSCARSRGSGAFLVLPAVVRMGRDRPLFCVFVAKVCATADGAVSDFRGRRGTPRDAPSVRGTALGIPRRVTRRRRVRVRGNPRAHILETLDRVEGGQRQFFLRRHARARRRARGALRGVRARGVGARSKAETIYEGRKRECGGRRECEKDSIEEVLRRETRSTFAAVAVVRDVQDVQDVVTRGRSDRSGFSSCG